MQDDTKKHGTYNTRRHNEACKDKTNIDAWITPAVATNEGDPRALQATQYKDRLH